MADGGRELDAYRRKRHADRTPEPAGDAAAQPSDGPPVFVVQRHSARRLHFDLRLEAGGVLKSWAVPKGLPTTRGVRRLAVHTEDHPLEYATFEGQIPAGEYGAGTMDIYDRGTYELVEAKRDGGLTVRLDGERLQGEWTLVPAALDGDPRNWLLLNKSGPEEPLPAPRVQPMLASPGDAAAARRRVAARGEVGRLPRPRPAGRRRAVPVVAPRAGPRRALPAHPQRPRARPAQPELRRGRRGRRVRRARACRASTSCRRRRAPSACCSSTCWSSRARRCTTCRWRSAASILEGLVDETSATVRLSRAFDDGEGLLAAARERGLEGVISKRRASKYVPGARSRDWVKVKAALRDWFPVIALRAGDRSRSRLGSLVVAREVDGELRYAGRVGSGLSEAEIDRILERLEPLVRDTPPAAVPQLPRSELRRLRWVEPAYEAEVEYAEVSPDGLLRQPRYAGLREREG